MDRSADALIGRVLDGRYRVGPKIARGGMATVYEATDLRLDRTVAVKVMHEGLVDDEEFVSRFQREARAAAKLAHHNVVAVFDTGDDHGTLFLVMEYVPGLTLRDLIRKEAPMSPAKALAMIEPVLSALAAAHDAGILHRDVKPENVLLADDGRVKVADFGLARAINSETQHTATGGVLIGTVSYLSPELVVNGKADARADVYAAGVLIYEMLTGHKPHQADSPIQVAYKHVHEDIPAPSASTPGIPPYVDALVARATARDTALRPADARVLLHQVRRVRNALDHGVVSDPDLLADLTPTTPIGGGRTPTGELPAQIIEPQELAEIADWDGGVYDQERDVRVVPPPPSGPRPPVRPAPPPPRRSSRRGKVMLIVVLLLALLAGLGGWYFGIARYTSTPSVLSLTEPAARVKLDRAGLDFKVEDQAYSETVKKGLVLSTDPGPGDRVLKDGTVGAVISLGPERHRVPDVRNQTLDDAQQALDEAKLAYGGDTERYDEKIAKGRVISTDPAVGTSLRRNAAVGVVVSKGPRPIKIPDFTGKPAAPAQDALERRGFKVKTTEVNDDAVPKGRVITQSPDSGTGQKDDVISLVVSKGPVMVEVPNVVGMGLDAATQRLEGAGFVVTVRHSSMYIGVQYVVATDPGRGSSAPKGSTVIVSIV
ncbi:Stk1 family PASTA domain-containing Ser/Thr kinase [Marmoricola sp. URHB0036]|uniref:Stk1 family PASTA domain-containing Ser/Thr kinase n=1 Tax=Marmoricola sp. URHB0036 TaxID=1298863 RepID=UPI00041B132E|nr:Stk1 family PASTA domain-containing Ser/Thr kinase [Marmoricola sp. URHB0036]